MAVNFGLLQPAQPASAFFQGQQDVQREAEQNMLRQQQAEQMQFQRENMLAQRGEREALAAERRRATEQQNALAEYVRSGMPQGTTGLAQFGKAGLDIAEGLRKERMGVLDEERKKLEYVTQRLASATSETYGAIRADLGRLSPEFVNALPAEYNGEQIGNIVRQGLALKDQLDLFKPMTVAPGASVFDPRTRQQMFTAPTAPRVSQLLTPEEEAQKTRIALASRPPPQPREPREPSAPVAVVDEATGRVKYVTREEAIGKTPAKEMEGLAPKEIQRREAVFPQAKQSVTTVTNTMSTIEQTIDRLLQNKSGLNGVTGLVYGRTPAVTDAARRADADLEQLANLAFVQGITELRAASKTGAGVGNVSNKEGDRFENLKASLKRTQSYDDMVAALTRLKAQATSTRDTVNTEFTDMYDYRQGRAAPSAPAAPAAGAQQPMYARNPTTGQRIMSTDGGNTWTPVR